jgi:hypothetical protein
MKKVLFLLLLACSFSLFAQDLQTPLERNKYARITSYDELSAYVKQLDQACDILTVEIAGTTVQGRNIYAMKFSSSEFGKDRSRIRVLIFAQQHGDEHSGKEGALLLARELVKPENRYLFKRIDLLLVPQMNPDGSEADTRRNGDNADLNRNHLLLTEPETIALHRLFDQYLFEVSMDVHEYYPFGETWKQFGYRDNTDELIGVNTNPNVSKWIREVSNTSFVPYMRQYCRKRQVSCFIYTPGGPPETDYIRHSTFDINDGRQSFGIQNTFSFIQEGLNGKDSNTDRIEHRAFGQMTGMRGFLEYAYRDKQSIQKMVEAERKTIMLGTPGESIAIQCEHAPNGEKLALPVYSYYSGKDSVINVVNYRPVVKSLLSVGKPLGYLVPKNLKDVLDWADRQGLRQEPFTLSPYCEIEQYSVNTIDSIDFEGDRVVDARVFAKPVGNVTFVEDYVYIPTSQLKGNILVIALEPRSMLGLVTYRDFAQLLKAGEKYPILRVVKK